MFQHRQQHGKLNPNALCNGRLSLRSAYYFYYNYYNYHIVTLCPTSLIGLLMFNAQLPPRRDPLPPLPAPTTCKASPT